MFIFVQQLFPGAWDSRIRLAKKSYGQDDNGLELLTQLVANEIGDLEGRTVFMA